MNQRGFTIVELTMMIVIVGILATISTLGYGSWRENSEKSVVRSDISHATRSLESHFSHADSYPHNLSSIDFSASKNISIVLFTNAPTIGVYENLSEEENAQLLLNVCNAVIFELDTSNTSCAFNGKNNGAKIHVKGTEGSNTHWNSPIAQTDVVLDCGAECDAAANDIIQQFLAQGGVFPIIVQGQQVPLPEPTETPNGTASRYCLEARSTEFSNLVYHTLDSRTAVTLDACPEDPELHYYP